MSPSTFRQHFRALTGVSPLQYQKQPRLLEPFTLAIAQLAYESGGGPEIGCRIERFGK